MTKLKLYNSLTKQIEEVEPIDGKTIRIYSCGPTVYNNAHIGNLATFIRDDLLKRVVRSTGYDFRHVMNITDVEDKIIRDSKKPEFIVEGDPMESLLNLTKKYTEVFKEDIKKLGNDIDSIQFIKATDTITEMLNLIQDLLSAGIAYRADDGIYFSIKNYLESGHEYGLLQKLNLNLNQERIKNDEYSKDDAADFALWKAKAEGEPFWAEDFEFVDAAGLKFSMPGRPGWHIECSAMSEKLLGVPFDIHTGGIDLKFPHHENEIAQSCGALKLNEFAKTFVHMNHIMVDGKKMSKSLGNFYTLRDIEEKGFSPQAFRLLVLSGHYQNETNFSWDILEAAQNRLNNWRSIAGLIYQGSDGDYNSNFREAISEVLADNLDTPRALSLIDQLVDEINQNPLNAKLKAKNLVEAVKDLLGINLSVDDISPAQKELIERRAEARANKMWGDSDEIRDLLLKDGIKLKDTDHGQVWSR
jgi:cysteinyl-tRNA synthetase